MPTLVQVIRFDSAKQAVISNHGTLLGFGCAANDNTFHATGIVHGAGSYHANGILAAAGAWYQDGILDGAGVYFSDGVYAVGHSRYSLDYAIEAAGGTWHVPLADEILYGVHYGPNSTLVGAWVDEDEILYGSNDPTKVLTTAPEFPGTYDAAAEIAAAKAAQLIADTAEVNAVKSWIARPAEGGPTDLLGVVGTCELPQTTEVLDGVPFGPNSSLVGIWEDEDDPHWLYGSNDAAKVLTTADAPGTFDAVAEAAAAKLEQLAADATDVDAVKSWIVQPSSGGPETLLGISGTYRPRAAASGRAIGIL